MDAIDNKMFKKSYGSAIVGNMISAIGLVRMLGRENTDLKSIYVGDRQLFVKKFIRGNKIISVDVSASEAAPVILKDKLEVTNVGTKDRRVIRREEFEALRYDKTGVPPLTKDEVVSKAVNPTIYIVRPEEWK